MCGDAIWELLPSLFEATSLTMKCNFRALTGCNAPRSIHHLVHTSDSSDVQGDVKSPFAKITTHSIVIARILRSCAVWVRPAPCADRLKCLLRLLSTSPRPPSSPDLTPRVQHPTSFPHSQWTPPALGHSPSYLHSCLEFYREQLQLYYSLSPTVVQHPHLHRLPGHLQRQTHQENVLEALSAAGREPLQGRRRLVLMSAASLLYLPLLLWLDFSTGRKRHRPHRVLPQPPDRLLFVGLPRKRPSRLIACTRRVLSTRS